MSDKGDKEEDGTYDIGDSDRRAETDGGEETEEAYELDFEGEEDSDDFAEFDDDFDDEFDEELGGLDDDFDDEFDEELGGLDEEDEPEDTGEPAEPSADEGGDGEVYGDLDEGAEEAEADAGTAGEETPEFDEEFADDLSDDVKGDLADDEEVETVETGVETESDSGASEQLEPEPETGESEKVEPEPDTAGSEQVEEGAAEPEEGRPSGEPPEGQEEPRGAGLDEAVGEAGEVQEDSGGDVVEDVEDALGMEDEAEEDVVSDQAVEQDTMEEAEVEETVETYGDLEDDEPEETVETYGDVGAEEQEAEPSAGAETEEPSTTQPSHEGEVYEEPEAEAEHQEEYGEPDEVEEAEGAEEQGLEEPEGEEAETPGTEEPVSEEAFEGGALDEAAESDEETADDEAEPPEEELQHEADEEIEPSEEEPDAGTSDGEPGDGSDGDGEVSVDATLDTGGGGVAVTGEGELDDLGDAMTEADEISSFFEDRTSGEGGIEEMKEVEGFFEPGSELQQAFGEDKLNTLLSEAKQGVAEYEGLEGYVEHERYWVNKPYAYVAILYSDTQNDHMYYVVEPRLDEYEETVRQDLEERLRDVLMYEEVDDDLDEEQILEKKVKKIIRDYGIEVESDSMHKILYYLKRDYIHDGKIDPIMRDPGVEDISCDGDNVPIFVYHRDYRDLMSNVEFPKDELDSFVIKLAQKAGKHISVADPLVDASMPDGSRIQMTLGTEVTDRGSTFTIRLFADEPFTPIDLINYNTFSLEQMAYLWTCIENNKSLIFAGGTASGKTTSMNAVTLFIPPKSKVISIEDTREITLPHMNWIPSVTRDSFSDDGVGAVDEYELLRAALRQRPEYLVVGEVRGEEALTLFQAMSTGHTTYSTMHADSVDSAIHRLENPPISVPRSMLKALDIVSIQAQTFVGGERVRRNMKIVEIIGIDPKTRNIRTDDIFQWNAETDSFVRTGNSTALQEIKRARGWSDEELQRELDERREVLQYMLDNDIAEYEDVSKIIQSFIIDRDRVLNQIREGEIDLEALSELKTLNL